MPDAKHAVDGRKFAKKIRENSRKFPGKILEFSRTFPAKILEIPPKITRNGPENVPEILRNLSQKSRKCPRNYLRTFFRQPYFSSLYGALYAPYTPQYAHIKVVAAFLVVNIFGLFAITRHHGLGSGRN